MNGRSRKGGMMKGLEKKRDREDGERRREESEQEMMESVKSRQKQTL